MLCSHWPTVYTCHLERYQCSAPINQLCTLILRGTNALLALTNCVHLYLLSSWEVPMCRSLLSTVCTYCHSVWYQFSAHTDHWPTKFVYVLSTCQGTIWRECRHVIYYCMSSMKATQSGIDLLISRTLREHPKHPTKRLTRDLFARVYVLTLNSTRASTRNIFHLLLREISQFNQSTNH